MGNYSGNSEKFEQQVLNGLLLLMESVLRIEAEIKTMKALYQVLNDKLDASEPTNKAASQGIDDDILENMLGAGVS